MPARHFVHGLFLGPALDDDAISGGHRAGAIGAVLAVHEHRLAPRVGHDLQEAHESIVTCYGDSGPSVSGSGVSCLARTSPGMLQIHAP